MSPNLVDVHQVAARLPSAKVRTLPVVPLWSMTAQEVVSVVHCFHQSSKSETQILHLTQDILANCQ